MSEIFIHSYFFRYTNSINNMSKAFKAAIAALGVYCSLFMPVKAQKSADDTNLKYVDPRIGNVGHLLQPTRPTVQLPNQMIRMFPLREDYLSDQINSFPLNVVSHRLGEVFAIKPFVGKLELNSWNKKHTYDHDLEVNKPWYFSTFLIDDNIKVEFVPGAKTGIYRFEFPDKEDKNILFDLYNKGEGNFTFTPDREFTGMETYHGNIKIYFYGILDADFNSGTLINEKISAEKKVSGDKAKAWIALKGATRNIEFKYALSYISIEQAKKNFDKELANKTFEQLKSAGKNEWSKVINQIQVEGGTEAQKRSFYTALYRCYERMVDITEEGQYFSGFDNKIHQTDRPFYVDDWAWDTYLAHHPLRIILQPKQEEDMLNSYVKMYEQSGWMPTFPVLFGDHACMNGFHSTISFLDAYRKGIKNYDVKKAYEGMRKNATQATMLPWRNGAKGPLEDFYYEKGFYPALKIGETETDTMVHSFEKRQSVAVTVGHSYDDWALSELAKELGVNADYVKFGKTAYNYKNLWNEKYRMFIPKDSEGKWININPKIDGGMGARDYYDENNGWTYKWQVQHDIDGLIKLAGGKEEFEKQLDELFREGLGMSKYAYWAKQPDATGLVGQFSMGNEPSFHIPYLYNYAGTAWKTQKRIRFLLDTWFQDNIFGIPGDEDGGGMTAFVVFSAMGFYPVTPGIPVYTIGSPVFNQISIALPNGKYFIVDAKNNSSVNKYIQSAKFNGKEINSPWFTHQELMEGGKLELEMGAKPNKNWGTDLYTNMWGNK